MNSLRGFMDETAKQVQEQVDQLQDVYKEGRDRLGKLAKSASEQSRRAMTFTDEWVRENPWLTVGIVAGVGLLVGLLVSQGFRRED
jgi:ElaB/YqjD/DUF883 family membrane-anchored ribosome-binding protein